MSVKEKVDQLVEKLNHLNHQYYNNHISEVSDFEFDQMLKELQDLEGQNPEFLRPDSPSHRVGGTISKDFPTVKHKYPMLSLSFQRDPEVVARLTGLFFVRIVYGEDAEGVEE